MTLIASKLRFESNFPPQVYLENAKTSLNEEGPHHYDIFFWECMFLAIFLTILWCTIVQWKYGKMSVFREKCDLSCNMDFQMVSITAQVTLPQRSPGSLLNYKCNSYLSQLTFEQHENSWLSCRLVMDCKCCQNGPYFAQSVYHSFRVYSVDIRCHCIMNN